MRPGLAKMMQKVHIALYVECPETDYQMAANAGCDKYADTWSSKRVK
jgi:hypothetical protein